MKELSRESRDLAGKAKEIEDAVYDLKAVNPNKKPNVDTRTPEELMNIIEAKGKEVAAALATLRGRTPYDGEQTHHRYAGAPPAPSPFGIRVRIGWCFLLRTASFLE